MAVLCSGHIAPDISAGYTLRAITALDEVTRILAGRETAFRESHRLPKEAKLPGFHRGFLYSLIVCLVITQTVTTRKRQLS